VWAGSRPCPGIRLRKNSGERPVEELPALSSSQPGVRAAAERMIVHGQEYLCVMKYSAPFASEQLHSVTTALSKVLPSMRRPAVELAKPAARFTDAGIRNKIARWLYSVRPVAAQNGSGSCKENLDVQPQGPRLRVAQVQSNHVVKTGAASPTDLPEPGDARLDF